MNRKYTPEMQEFIAAHSVGMHTDELAELVSTTFNVNVTASAIRSYQTRHKLPNGLHGGDWRNRTRLFTPEIHQFIVENVKGITSEELANRVSKKFGINLTSTQLRNYKARYNLRSGVDARFHPGFIPHNKGKKGYYAPGCEKGWFKKGQAPTNHHDVGTEVMGADGYLKVKIAEPNVWKLKHILLWESARGPIPEGHKVIFLDQDHTNVKLDNLALVTDAELLMLNQHGLVTENAELTQAGIMVSRVRCVTAKIKRERKKGKHRINTQSQSNTDREGKQPPQSEAQDKRN